MKQEKSLKPITPSFEKAMEFLLKEYDILKDLYSQSISEIQGLFNFYLTILSAIIGAIIFIIQSAASASSNLGVIGGLLVFAVVVGVFYQAGIVNRYADRTRYAKAISEIRIYMVKHLPEASPPLYELPFKISSPSSLRVSAIERWEQRMWWLFPISTHQLFIAFMNSICVAALLWILLIYAQMASVRLWQGGLASFVAFWLSVIANDSYAKIKLEREITKHSIRMNQ